jgi:hypothetical protein
VSLDARGQRGSAGRLEQEIEAATEVDHGVGAAGEPRAYPLGPLKERERSLAGAADGAAADEAAGVDEADLIEHAAGVTQEDSAPRESWKVSHRFSPNRRTPTSRLNHISGQGVRPAAS